jgi:hypothetical protein
MKGKKKGEKGFTLKYDNAEGSCATMWHAKRKQHNIVLSFLSP